MLIKKILIFLFLFVNITNCGFSPIYKGGSNLNLKIVIENLSGDRETFNLISSNLNTYSYEESNKIAKIDIETNYKKTIIAKDSTGKPTDFRMELKTIFDVRLEDLDKKFIYTETFNYKSFNNNFEQLEYEKTLKQNMTQIISQKILTQLSRY
jgi:hypothetical protein